MFYQSREVRKIGDEVAAGPDVRSLRRIRAGPLSNVFGFDCPAQNGHRFLLGRNLIDILWSIFFDPRGAVCRGHFAVLIEERRV